MIHDAPQLAGLGDANTTAAQITSVGGQIATVGVTATTSASTAAIAVPIIGAAVLAATLILVSIAKKNAQKKAATSIVNDVEPALRGNVEGYLAGPRTAQSQAQALANFDTGWNLVLANCGAPELGSAGRRCIEERQQGGAAPWCSSPDHRGCDWFALYRDPIANDTPRETVAADVIGQLFPTSSPAELDQMMKYAALAAVLIGVASL